MTRWCLIARSLWHYRRTHAGVVAGAAVATTVLVGALLVGDSVRGSLRDLADRRLGDVRLALQPPERLFREKLAAELSEDLGVPVAPVLELRGTVTTSRDDGERKVIPNCRILGVDERFWKLAGTKSPFSEDDTLPPEADAPAVLNDRLAVEFADGTDVVRVLIALPGALPTDAPLATDEADTARATLSVTAVAGPRRFGRFDLRANQVAPYNVFVPLAWLQRRCEVAGQVNRAEPPHPRVNLLLVGGGDRADPTPDAAATALRKRFTLADAEAELRVLPEGSEARVLELRSRRVFLERPLAEAATKAPVPALGALTYLANEIHSGDAVVPYSMVAALGVLTPPAGAQSLDDPAWRLATADLDDDETIISRWLAEEDLTAAAPIERVTLRYYAVTPEGGLEERPGGPFRVHGRPRPLDEGPDAALMRELMPKVPHLPDDPTLDDLRLGTRIDRDLINRFRDKLDAYWRDYSGTPKAFVSLEAGRRLWANRWGDLTAVRFPPDAEPVVRAALRRHLDPAALGFVFRPVREQARAASAEGTDFGQLFVSLSFFLVAAGVLLTALLFVFGIEQRAAQTGLLKAVGLRTGQIRRLMLAEGAVLAVAGSVLGTAGGGAYAWLMLHGLGTLWQGAVPTATIRFHAEPLTLVGGAAAGVIVALVAMAMALWHQARRPARALLAGEAPHTKLRGRHRWLAWLVPAGLAAALVGVLVLPAATADAQAGKFFAAGALMLLVTLSAAYALLAGGGGVSRRGRPSLPRLGLRNAARRPGRSLATAALLACGCFLIVAIGVFRQDPLARADGPSSGTGGYDLYAETAVGLPHDFTTSAGRDALRLGEEPFAGVTALPVRLREGDDATCLNLNRAQTPRLLGVDARALDERGAFSFVGTLEPTDHSWRLLQEELDDGVVPGIAEAETIQWALGRKLGDVLTFRDESGSDLRVRLVASLKNSILQGTVLIDERRFVERYPSLSGHRLWLIDTPDGRRREVRDALLASPELREYGLKVTPAADRLAAFLRVKNTYLSVFQLLGGLGLLLGTAALAIVVLRNVLERRAELALLRAVGFRRGDLVRLLLAEHWLLLAAGLACGVAAGALATAPALSAAGADVSYRSLGALLAAVAVGGAAWTALATALATRGELLPALRSE